jgi:uncharacterized membrane protein
MRVDEKRMMAERTASRRRVLCGAAAAVPAALAGAAVVREARAQQKVPQTSVQYQNSPKGEQRCDNCALWQPPNACSAIEGPIAPQGWCAIWAPKA